MGRDLRTSAVAAEDALYRALIPHAGSLRSIQAGSGCLRPVQRGGSAAGSLATSREVRRSSQWIEGNIPVTSLHARTHRWIVAVLHDQLDRFVSERRWNIDLAP